MYISNIPSFRQEGYEILDWTKKLVTDPYPYFTYGAGVTEVEVDCLTGSHVVRTVLL